MGTWASRAWRASWTLAALAALLGMGCEAAKPPPTWRRIELVGSPYERGFQHGQAFASDVRRLYTKLLATSIIPYVSRERDTIAEYLLEYQDARYDGDQFAYLVFLESGQHLEQYMPPDYVDEMHGIADGAGIEYEKILILNTFFDTLMAFRALSFYLRLRQGPQPVRVAVSGADGDGADNDGDGQVDEPGEGTLDPFEPSGWVNLAEIDPDSAVTVWLETAAGVDPASIRLQTEARVYTVDDPDLQVEVYGDADEGLAVTFQPIEAFPEASYVPLIVSAGDLTWNEDPPPAHEHTMRDMRLAFTTRGFGALPQDVPSRSFDDGRSQPPSMAFAVRGSATADGAPLLGQHFSLLDSNTSHDHCVIFLHRPDEGRAHVTVGWTGGIIGFSGMNEDGLAYAVNASDTLDNPLVGEFRDLLIAAKMLSSGMVIGVLGREMLRTCSTVGEAIQFLRRTPMTFGWNFLLTDASGDMALVEVDSNIDGDATSFHVVTPDTSDASNLDDFGRPLASVGPDDLRTTVHYRANREDIRLSIFGYEVVPQYLWSTYWYRSQRSFHLLGDAISDGYGAFDVAAVEQVLSIDELVDQRDSMNAVVFDPVHRQLHVAFGQVPATAGPFIPFDIRAWMVGEDPTGGAP